MHVRALLSGGLQGTGQFRQHGTGNLTDAALLDAGVVVQADTSQVGDLLTAQPGDPAVGTRAGWSRRSGVGRQSDVLRLAAVAQGSQELTEPGTARSPTHRHHACRPRSRRRRAHGCAGHTPGRVSRGGSAARRRFHRARADGTGYCRSLPVAGGQRCSSWWRGARRSVHRRRRHSSCAVTTREGNGRGHMSLRGRRGEPGQSTHRDHELGRPRGRCGSVTIT